MTTMYECTKCGLRCYFSRLLGASELKTHSCGKTKCGGEITLSADQDTPARWEVKRAPPKKSKGGGGAIRHQPGITNSRGATQRSLGQLSSVAYASPSPNSIFSMPVTSSSCSYSGAFFGSSSSTDPSPSMPFSFSSPAEVKTETIENKHVLDVQLFEQNQQGIRLRTTENLSQKKLYNVLNSRKFLFLCEDGQYRSLTEPDADSCLGTVLEPGFTDGRPYVFKGKIQGRDQRDMSRGLCASTYPDFFGKFADQVFAIELKTPASGTFFSYLSDYFGELKHHEEGKTIRAEIEQRKRHLPMGVQQILLFDLENIDGKNAIKELVQYIAQEDKDSPFQNREAWFESHISGYMFFNLPGADLEIFSLAKLKSAASSKGPTLLIKTGPINAYFSKK